MCVLADIGSLFLLAFVCAAIVISRNNAARRQQKIKRGRCVRCNMKPTPCAVCRSAAVWKNKWAA